MLEAQCFVLLLKHQVPLVNYSFLNHCESKNDGNVCKTILILMWIIQQDSLIRYPIWRLFCKEGGSPLPLGTHKATRRIKHRQGKIRRKMPGAADLRKLQYNKHFTD